MYSGKCLVNPPRGEKPWAVAAEVQSYSALMADESRRHVTMFWMTVRMRRFTLPLIGASSSRRLSCPMMRRRL